MSDEIETTEIYVRPEPACGDRGTVRIRGPILFRCFVVSLDGRGSNGDLLRLACGFPELQVEVRVVPAQIQIDE